MSILDYIFSKLPDNSSKQIAAKDVRDSFEKMDERIDEVRSGIKNTATQSNAPTPYDAVTYPNGLFETYVVRVPLTMPNSWGSAVTQAELDANNVYFDVKNGVITKSLSKKATVDLSATLNPLGTTKAPQEKAVADYVAPFFEVLEAVNGNQLFDKSTVTLSFSTISSSGNINPNNDNIVAKITDTLKVGNSYTLKGDIASTNNGGGKIAFYNDSNVLISFIKVVGTSSEITFTIPASTKNTYLHLGTLTGISSQNIRDNSIVNSIMLNNGSTALPFENYIAPNYLIKSEKIKVSDILHPTQLKEISGSKAVADYLSTFITKEKIISKNLLDWSKVSFAKTMSIAGVLTTSAAYNVSDFISVLPSTSYSGKPKVSTAISTIRRIVFFDSNKAVLSAIDSATDTFETPTNTAYVRIMFSSTYVGFSLVLGLERNYYEFDLGFNFKLSQNSNPVDDNSIITLKDLEKYSKSQSGAIEIKKISNNILIRTKFNTEKDLVRTIVLNGSQNNASNITSTKLITKSETIDSSGDVLQVMNDSMPGPLKVNVNQGTSYLNLGGNHGMQTVTDVVSNAHGKTNADLFSIWTDGSGWDWYLAEITDSNRLRFISKPKNISGSDQIKGQPSSPLNHVSGATNTGSVTFTGSVYEFKPFLTDISVKLYVDSVEIIADGSYFGNEVKVIDNHSVPDPRQPTLTAPYSPKNNGLMAKNTIITTFYKNNSLSVETILNSLKETYYLNYNNIRPQVLNDTNYSEFKLYAMNVNAVSGFNFKTGIDFKTFSSSLDVKKTDLIKQYGIKSISSILSDSGNPKIGMNVSFNPLVGFGKSEYALLNDDQFNLRGDTKKIYPNGIFGNVGLNIVRGIEYLSYWDASINPKLATDFFVPFGDENLYFISLKSSMSKEKVFLNKEITLKTFDIIQKSDSFIFNTEEMTTSEGLIISGSVGDWAVIKVK